MEKGNLIYLTSDELSLLDNNYRYVVDKPIFNMMNKKGRIITIFENCVEFSKSIHIDHELLTRIIAVSLSCSYKINNKENLIYFIGEYKSQTITNIICKFIKTYLLCQICDYPELKLKYKNKKIKQICDSCGYSNYCDEQYMMQDDYEIILKHLKKI